mmetsp:Transcript_6215/g.11940  ORF Transcript_6215/g.11940 Transcript_6215/m.11940 type:complete len:242 (+) Transcript_6215:54-779(+)
MTPLRMAMGLRRSRSCAECCRDMCGPWNSGRWHRCGRVRSSSGSSTRQRRNSVFCNSSVKVSAKRLPVCIARLSQHAQVRMISEARRSLALWRQSSRATWSKCERSPQLWRGAFEAARPGAANWRLTSTSGGAVPRSCSKMMSASRWLPLEQQRQSRLHIVSENFADKLSDWLQRQRLRGRTAALSALASQRFRRWPTLPEQRKLGNFRRHRHWRLLFRRQRQLHWRHETEPLWNGSASRP